MSVIAMIGPHAVGKTTMARRWLQKYGHRLTIAIADDQWEESVTGRVRVRDWKGTKEEKFSRMMFHKRRNGITLVESARGFSTWMAALDRSDPVIVLTCSEPDGRRFIEQRRNAKKNPKPLSDYWTERRLDYECNAHLLNYVRKLDPAQVKHFVISDRERDWAPVDEYFGKVFRRLYNSTLRNENRNVHQSVTSRK